MAMNETSPLKYQLNNSFRNLIPLVLTFPSSSSYPHNELYGELVFEFWRWKSNDGMGGNVGGGTNLKGWLSAKQLTSDSQNLLYEEYNMIFPLRINGKAPYQIGLSNTRSGGFTRGTIEVWGVPFKEGELT
ncbi:hypothetical protein KHA94_13430 [Bacillus sp. FJAT-49705]|uniref:Uncharacterized protein n=1 Tax=Cytobacillus citreus TaxID=2833586 RepID=A0ABS5NTM6_9BACI|nr:hypothetical protein [Cytobacillus citreus]MBS4191185.1 hypothetical protein [Cytobacillus citreus]